MIVVEQAERVRVLRLSHPPANVLNLEMLAALRRETAAAVADAGTRCIVLASAYPRYFSTGLDLAELTGLAPERRTEHFGSMVAGYRALRASSKPTLAAIGGSAILGGWILAMGCDYRLLSEGGRIALSEIRAGITPTAALVSRLREMASRPDLARDMVLRGRTLRSEEALAGGFVDRVVPPKALQEEAMKEARSLCKLPPRAYAAVKQALWGRTPEAEEALWRESREDFERVFAGPEAREGVAALRDKRRPRWED